LHGLWLSGGNQYVDRKKMALNLTPAQFQVLAGLLDQAIKTLGLRAMEDDVVDLMQAVKAAAKTQEMQDAA
jgi:hypothetical protein